MVIFAPRNQFVNTKRYIQKLLAGFLLLVFLISTAPRSYFHDLIANHKDQASCSLSHKAAVVHKMATNCHFDDLVVTAPFVLIQSNTLCQVSVYRYHWHADLPGNSLPVYSAFVESRGPPSV